MTEMTAFYSGIGAGIRKLVKALRDNGINTIRSCHHEWYIEAYTDDPTEELETIHAVMYTLGIKNYTVAFNIVVRGNEFNESLIITVEPTEAMEKAKTAQEEERKGRNTE